MNLIKMHSAMNTQSGSKSAKYIVMHYTAGNYGTGAARANAKYFSSGDRNASADYFVDSDEIVEFNDRKTSGRFTWHCGGGTSYGATNSNAIGIEVCMKGDSPYTAGEIALLKELVPYLMERYGISKSNIIRHYDCNSIRKPCPLYYSRRDSEWKKLLDKITVKDSKPEPKKERAQAMQAAYNDTDAQKWSIVECEDGYVKIVNSKGTVLDVKGGSTEPMSNGRRVQAYKDNGTDAQRWKIIDSPYISGAVMLESKLDSDYVAEVTGGTVNKRAYIQMHKKQSSIINMYAQHWYLLPTYDGYLAIVNGKSLWAMDTNPTNLDLN